MSFVYGPNPLQRLQAAYASACKELRPFSSRWVEGEEEAKKKEIIARLDHIRAGIRKMELESMEPSFLLRCALAIYAASDAYEASYVPDGSLSGRYSRSYDDCIIEAVEAVKLPKEMWRLIDLAASPTSWSNDAHDWADSVLGGTFEADYSNTEPEPTKEKREVARPKVNEDRPRNPFVF
jgi:hypothetical protein